jgi:D-inositol-3-phosphate glycosyltransferase
MMLNIAMISYHTCPLATLGGKDTGGMNVYVQELTRHLGKAGVHVDVFTRSQDEHVPQVLHDLGYGNRVVHIPAGPEIPMPKQELAEYLPKFVEGVRHFAAEKNIQYDLIHSHYWMSGVAARELKVHWGVPVIHMFHTLGMMKNRIARSPAEMEGEYRITGEQQVLQTADRIVAATPAEKTQLEFLYHADPRQITIIPPGVDTSHFYPIPEEEAKAFIGITRDDRMILFVGRIEPLKGIETLIRAISLLSGRGILTRCAHYLTIIGGDISDTESELTSELQRLKALTRQVGIEDLVLFLGKRDQSSLPYYYSAAEVLVMPSHYESFGMVALEAMACGTPVVASQVGGLAYLVQDGITGFSIPDGDPEALADSLALLVCKDDLRKKMGEQAAHHARQYDWDIITQQILELYQTLSEPAPGLPQ